MYKKKINYRAIFNFSYKSWCSSTCSIKKQRVRRLRMQAWPNKPTLVSASLYWTRHGRQNLDYLSFCIYVSYLLCFCSWNILYNKPNMLSLFVFVEMSPFLSLNNKVFLFFKFCQWTLIIIFSNFNLICDVCDILCIDIFISFNVLDNSRCLLKF